MSRRIPPLPTAAPLSDDASTPGSEVATPDVDDFVHHPHDAFFKSIFGDVRNAAEVLRTALPARVSAHIDWDSLQAVKASFVDDALKQRHGDLVYLARLTQGGKAFLWVLFEHQSSVEWWMSWRLMRMMLNALEAWRVQEPEAMRLPPVLPVVLYQGTTPWTAPTSFGELFELSDEARRDMGEYLLSFRYVLENLQATPDQDLEARDLSVVTRVSLVTMKHARSDDLIERLVALAERGDLAALLSTEQGRASWRRMVRYILACSNSVDLNTLAEVLAPVAGEEMREAMLTFGQKMELEILERVTAKANARIAEANVEIEARERAMERAMEQAMEQNKEQARKSVETAKKAAEAAEKAAKKAAEAAEKAAEKAAEAAKKAAEKAAAKATQEAQRELLLRQLTRRFGVLSVDVAARVRQAGTPEIEDWADRILDATSLDELFTTARG